MSWGEFSSWWNVFNTRTKVQRERETNIRRCGHRPACGVAGDRDILLVTSFNAWPLWWAETGQNLKMKSKTTFEPTEKGHPAVYGLELCFVWEYFVVKGISSKENPRGHFHLYNYWVAVLLTKPSAFKVRNGSIDDRLRYVGLCGKWYQFDVFFAKW